jgi:CRP-like cAMP-binding protein
MAGGAEIVSALERVGLFQGFERAEIERILARGHVIEFPGGAILFREGDPGEGLYLVVAGSVRIIKTVVNVGEEAMAVAEAGDFFGEMALIDDMPRSATAEAREASRLFLLRKADFLDLVYTDPALGCKVLWTLCRSFSRRLRETTERINALFAVSRAW